MHHLRRSALSVVALAGALCGPIAHAGDIKTVFVIAMENHNWTQPTGVAGSPQQVYLNQNAPFINSLVNGTAVAIVNGRLTSISQQVSYASAYHNALATPTGMNPSIHPSEPNYIWAEAGTNFGVANDDNPYHADCTVDTNQNTNLHLSSVMTLSGVSWKSYQEDTDVSLTDNSVLPASQFTVPLFSFSGSFPSGKNAFNNSAQFNYAAKHNPMVYFTDTNGGCDKTASNALASQYAPLQQFFTDLQNDTVAQYNWISPNQYNDMHTALTGGYKGVTGDSANIKQGDDFLSQIVPVIMSSDAYKNHGAIIIWFDETENDGVGNANDFNHTVGEIVISSHAHSNVKGVPYASPVNFTHSSDLRTMQEIFRLGPPFLGDAANAADLSDLFAPGAF
jgi:hypothetical protein